MRGGTIGVLLRHELRMLMRDTRMLLITFGVPVVVFPALIFLMRNVESREEQRLERTVFRYAVSPELDADARSLLRRVVEAGVPRDAGVEAGAVEAARPAEARNDATFRGDPTAPPPMPARFEESTDTSDTDVLVAPDPGDARTLRLAYRADDDFSRAAASELRDRLARVRNELRDSILSAAGLPVAPERVAAVESVNVATPEREGGALLGLMLMPFVLLLLLTGGSIAAVDTLSGEKERGTLETLLTTAATRHDIVRAKQLAIALLGFGLVIVNAANLLAYVVLGVVPLPESLALSLAPFDLVLIVLLLAPLTALTASALLLLSGRTSSYRDYQVAFFPLLLVFLAPALASMLPGMELRSAVAFAPVTGIGVAIRELAVGERDFPFLAIAFLSTALPALWISRLTERALSTERLIEPARARGTDAPPGHAHPSMLFPRHVLRWFALMWAAFFTVSLWLGESLELREQVVLNLVVVFGGGSLLMIRRYRLPWRETLALRRPPALAWIAVLIGAPAGYVTGIGIASLVDAFLFPVPEGVLEAFGDVMLGAELPLWQLLLFLAVLPGVLEEIAFRGVLLHGLSRRLHPLVLCLAVGAVFGLFHVSLFRIVPTAYLGTLLAAVVVLTGSIWPAMAWHALNNAIALVPAHMGWVGVDTRLPAWSYAVAVLALVASWTLLTRGHPRRHAALQGRDT